MTSFQFWDKEHLYQHKVIVLIYYFKRKIIVKYLACNNYDWFIDDNPFTSPTNY